MIPLIEIEFDTGTRFYSREGVRTPTQYYEPFITSFGGLQRSVALLPGDYRAAQVSVEFSNASNVFSVLRVQKNFRNRIMKVQLLDETTGVMMLAFKGRISNWSISSTGATIEAVDTIQSRLRAPLNYVIDPNFFDNLPGTTPRNLIPLVIGTAEADFGAVPAYLVDPAIGQATYRYVMAQGRVPEPTAVYAYGVLVDPADYAISYITGPDDTEITTIDFTADQQVVGDTTEPHIAWNGSGITDDSTETGNPVPNGAEQLAKVLRLNGFDANDIDATTVAAAASALTALQITGVFVATDPALTIGQVVTLFASNYNLQIFATTVGLIGMIVPVTNVVETAGLPEITALQDVIAGSFEVKGPEDVASSLNASYNYNWFTGGFLNTLVRTNSHQVSALGEAITLPSEHPFLRDLLSMTAVADAKLFHMREDRRVVSLTAAAHWYADLDIGDFITLTHFAGIGDTGYEQQLFRVIGLSVISDGATLLTGLTLVDITSEPVVTVPTADFSRRLWVRSDFYQAGFVVRGRLRFGEDAAVPGGGDGAEATFAGRTVVTGHLGIAFNFAGGTAAGSTVITPPVLSSRLVLENLQHFYTFSEGSGQVLTDWVGGIDGELGSGSGSDTNDPTWAGPGLIFDGIDNYITIPAFQETSNGSWTLVVVFQSNTNPSGATLFAQKDGAQRADWLAHSLDPSSFSSGLPDPALIGPTITPGTWYVGYLRRDFDTNLLRINLRSTASNPTVNVTDTVQQVVAGTMIIGASSFDFPSTINSPWSGIMGLLMHYNAYKTDEAMTSIFNGAKAIMAERGVSI